MQQEKQREKQQEKQRKKQLASPALLSLTQGGFFCIIEKNGWEESI